MINEILKFFGYESIKSRLNRIMTEPYADFISVDLYYNNLDENCCVVKIIPRPVGNPVHFRTKSFTKSLIQAENYLKLIYDEYA